MTPEQFLDRDVQEQMRLERLKGVWVILDSYPEMKGNERMFMRKLSHILYNENPEAAFALWQRISPANERQARATNISKQRFLEIHERAQGYLNNQGSKASITDTIALYREKESPKGPGYRWNDNYQRSQKEKRSLAQLQERGVKLSVPQEGIEVFQQYLKDKPEVPLIESGKNDRFITLNGFRDSLMTLTIHDVVDHFLVTSLLRESGIEGRYRDFFAAIGNPADTDLFSREGEVLASVVYSRRVVGMVEQGIKPTFTVERILRLLEKSENVTPNQEEAARYLREVVAPDAELSHQFSYVVTSTIIELLEQRRKQGFVRMLNDEFDIVRNMSLVEPEYIALMVDTVKMLNELEPRMQMFTGNAAVLIEEFFRHLCAGGQLPPNLEGRVRQEEGKPQELVMRAADLMDDSVAEQSTLPEDVVQWIYDNPGFTATQQALR